jgi:hypothetical protein
MAVAPRHTTPDVTSRDAQGSVAAPFVLDRGGIGRRLRCAADHAFVTAAQRQADVASDRR